jgi:hypothetical protein
MTEGDIPATPSAKRSSRRAGSATPLPAIASRASTAYGTNTTVQPAPLRVPEAGEDAAKVLNSLLAKPSHTLPAVREEDTPSDTSSKFMFIMKLRNALLILPQTLVVVELPLLMPRMVVEEVVTLLQLRRQLIEAMPTKAGSLGRLELNLLS